MCNKRENPFFIGWLVGWLEMEKVVVDYFARLVEGWPVRVRHTDETRGNGCFATTPVEARAVVFSDQPLACLQVSLL